MSSRPIAGPSLPPGYSTSSNSHLQDDDDDDDGDDIGPALPPSSSSSSQVASHHDGMSDAVRAFVEREERQRRAEAEAQATQEAAKTTRPDWMLAPPPSSSLSSLLQPTGAPLKARGFSQNTRVQKGASIAAGVHQEEGLNLWTETPQERMDRMKNQVLGSSSTHSTPSSDFQLLEEEGRRRMTLLRDAELKERVRKLDGQTARTKSLLELHPEARRRDFVEQKGKRKEDVEGIGKGARLRGLEDLNELSDEEERTRRGEDASEDDDDEERRSRRRRGREDEDEEKSRRKERRREERNGDDERRERRRHRSRSRSPEHRNRPRRKDRGEREDDEDRSRRRQDERDRDHRRHHHKSSSSSSSSSKRHHHHHHHRHHRSPSEQPNSRSHQKAKHKSEEEEESKNRRKTEEAEVVVGKTAASSSTMIWDRERAMSFIPLMDEKKRAKLLHEARGLGDRFGSSNSGSKFL